MVKGKQYAVYVHTKYNLFKLNVLFFLLVIMLQQQQSLINLFGEDEAQDQFFHKLDYLNE